MIKSLNALRGLLIMCVVAIHVFGLFTEASYGFICFLFMLSGFVLMRRYGGQELEEADLRTFYVHRYSKIYPLHLVTLLGAVLFSNWGLRWHLPLNALLLQGYVPQQGVYFGYNTTSWFLCVVVLCYALFPFLARLLQKLSIGVQLGIVVAIVVAQLAIYPQLPYQYYEYWAYVLPLSRVPDFVVGMVAWSVCRSVVANRADGVGRSALVATVIEVFLILICVMAYYIAAPHGYMHYFRAATIWYVPLSLVLIYCTVADVDGGLLVRTFRLGVFQWLGRISFEVYMCHISVVTLLNRVLSMTGASLSAGLYAVVYLAIVLAVAWAMHMWFTQPVARLIEDCFSKKNRPVAI